MGGGSRWVDGEEWCYWIPTVSPRPASPGSRPPPRSFPWSLLESALSLPALRDLTELKAEHVRLSGSLLTCCLRLTVGTQPRESDGPARLDGSEPAQLLLLLAKTQELEKEAHERSQELMQLRSQGDLEQAELQDR